VAHIEVGQLEAESLDGWIY